jgi:hypothetical protein
VKLEIKRDFSPKKRGTAGIAHRVETDDVEEKSGRCSSILLLPRLISREKDALLNCSALFGSIMNLNLNGNASTNINDPSTTTPVYHFLI